MTDDPLNGAGMEALMTMLITCATEGMLPYDVTCALEDMTALMPGGWVVQGPQGPVKLKFSDRLKAGQMIVRCIDTRWPK